MSWSFPYPERARLVREAHRALHETFAKVTRRRDETHPATQRWLASVKALRAALEVAYPPDFWSDLDGLRHGDTAYVDTFIDFLEADPMFFRSGYVKTEVLRLIKRQSLTPRQVERLRAVVLGLIERRWGREIGDYARLALRVDGDAFRQSLSRLSRSTNLDTVRRAERILATLPAQVGGPPRNWRRRASR